LKVSKTAKLMFGQLESSIPPRRQWVRISSLALHGIVLALLLRPLEPRLLNPAYLSLGNNGKIVTRLYWDSKTHDDSAHDSSEAATQRYNHQRFAQQKLKWKAPAELAKLSPPVPVTPTEDNSKTQMLSALGHGTRAGSAYGTLTTGQLYGDEVRPALPVATSDPVVWPWQLPTTAGNEVIEITIDERGEIVSKTVLQSLGADIDAKCLAALEGWHFHPATHNGAPIPSKQDTVFPFKARG
jgi:hypothetical protein